MNFVLFSLSCLVLHGLINATEDEARSHPHGRSLQVLKFNDDLKVVVENDKIDGVFLHPEVIDRKIVVVSIIGAFRKGKSFLMDYCLRFMYANYKSVNFMNNPLDHKRGWIGEPDEPLKGFSWKSGSQRHTTGVVIWSDVFLHEEKGEKLAIVLMDTQGLFDTKTSTADNSRIFALGTLISSVQIFNLNDVIQEDQLQYLHMATDYAKYASSENVGKKKTNAKPFQNLLFLLRDWPHENDFNYGLQGGALYLAEVLNIRDEQSSELKAVRKYIKSSFDTVNCFLLPHPGFKALKNPNYDGNWADLEELFKSNLEDLLDWLLAPKNMKKKRVLGFEVTGKTFNEYVKKYFEIFQSPETPQMPSVYQLIVQKHLENYLVESLEGYKTVMKLYENTTSTNFVESLDEGHKMAKSNAVLFYRSRKKMGSEDDDLKYEAELETEIEEYFKQRRENLVSTFNRINEIEVKTKAEISRHKEEAEEKIRIQNELMNAEKQRLEEEMVERERKAEQDIRLLEEEKKVEIARIKSENEEKRKQVEAERQKLIEEQKTERENLQREADERTRFANIEIEKLQNEKINNQQINEMKLKVEREERLMVMKQEAGEKREQRQLEQARMDQEAKKLAEERKVERERIEHQRQERMDQREKEEAQRRFDIEQDKLERKEAREEARIQTVERRKDENDREMRRLASEERMQANALLIAKPDGRSVVCKLIGMTC